MLWSPERDMPAAARSYVLARALLSTPPLTPSALDFYHGKVYFRGGKTALAVAYKVQQAVKLSHCLNCDILL